MPSRKQLVEHCMSRRNPLVPRLSIVFMASVAMQRGGQCQLTRPCRPNRRNLNPVVSPDSIIDIKFHPVQQLDETS
jgi:hypothetical protein